MTKPMTLARRKRFVKLYHEVSDASLDAVAMANDCRHDTERSDGLFNASQHLYKALGVLREVLDNDDDRRSENATTSDTGR
jgi:hypothetical protein